MEEKDDGREVNRGNRCGRPVDEITSWLRSTLNLMARDGVLPVSGLENWESRFKTARQLSELAEASFVIESIPENLDLKRESLPSIGTGRRRGHRAGDKYLGVSHRRNSIDLPAAAESSRYALVGFRARDTFSGNHTRASNQRAIARTNDEVGAATRQGTRIAEERHSGIYL
jgi:hypothetical protein